MEFKDIDEIGILDPILPTDSILAESMNWISDSPSTNPRTVWFLKPSGFNRRLPPMMKSRMVPMDLNKHRAWCDTGPFQALLLRQGAPPLEDRGFAWLKTYSAFGEMVLTTTWHTWNVWKWVPKRGAAKRALMICHHCGVLPDLRRQLSFLGIRGEFVWLCDGKPPTGDAWESTLGEFDSSVPLLKGPIGASPEVIAHIKEKYDMVITSHCARYPLHFIETGLPLFHINSTRFGNEIVTRADEFTDLCARITGAIESGQLTIIHNNLAEKWYFEQYIGCSRKFPVVPSLCLQALKFRIEDTKKKILIWDTRFHITDETGSKTLRDIAGALKADSTSQLSNDNGAYLDDDMLDEFRAVVHVPYNISTMSCFEQAAANVPMWIPSPKFMERILSDPLEHSELSWFCFNEDLRSNAGRPDQVWDREVVHEYVSRADFTGFRNVLFFDSIEDLVARIDTVDYATVIKESFLFQTQKKLDILTALDGIF